MESAIPYLQLKKLLHDPSSLDMAQDDEIVPDNLHGQREVSP
tara:strand:- start:699 stop:824 length:126 start_codon:yes stop_codon:yes gene_type:complete